MNMHITVEMDRPITERHYITPGGFDFKIAGKDVEFDFSETAGGRTFPLDDKKPNLYSCTLRYLDVTSFPESAFIASPTALGQIEKINDFFIYTGEKDDPEINVVKIVDAAFELNGKMFPIPSAVLEEYNDTLHCKKCSYRSTF